MTGEKPKLRKREILLALGAGALAAGGIAIAIDNDDGESFEVATDSGDEAMVDLTYDFAGFDAVGVNGAENVRISYGEKFSVRGKGPGSAMGEIEVVVEDGVLLIRPAVDNRDFWDSFGDTKFEITMPLLTRLTTTGASNIEIDRVAGESFEAVIGGVGEISIEDMDVQQASFRITGAGEVDIFGSATCSIAQSGLGGVTCGSEAN